MSAEERLELDRQEVRSQQEAERARRDAEYEESERAGKARAIEDAKSRREEFEASRLARMEAEYEVERELASLAARHPLIDLDAAIREEQVRAELARIEADKPNAIRAMNGARDIAITYADGGHSAVMKRISSCWRKASAGTASEVAYECAVLTLAISLNEQSALRRERRRVHPELIPGETRGRFIEKCRKLSMTTEACDATFAKASTRLDPILRGLLLAEIEMRNGLR